MYLPIFINAALLIFYAIAVRRILCGPRSQADRVFFALITSSCSVFNATAFLWQLSLVPPLNSSNSPKILGVGGAAYGLEYERYLECTCIYSACGLAMASVVLLAYRRVVTPEAKTGLQQMFITQLGRRMVGIAALLSLLLFITYFSLEGWSRLYKSDLGRFESASEYSAFIDARMYSVGFMILGVVLSLGCGIRDRRLLALAALSLPFSVFVVMASRGFTVITCIAMFSFALSLSGLRRWVCLLLLVPVLLMAYILPLNLRHQGGTGYYYFFRALGEVVRLDYRGLGDTFTVAFQNVSAGFPVFVEAYAGDRRGLNIMQDAPLGYRVLSFSPLPSFLDGYRANYHVYRRMLNPVTPFNMLSEIYSIGKFLPFVVYPVICLLALALYRWLTRKSGFGSVVGPFYGVLFVFFVIYCQQYPTRGSMKIFYYGAAIVLLLGVFLGYAYSRFPAFSPTRRSHVGGSGPNLMRRAGANAVPSARLGRNSGLYRGEI